MKHTGKNILHKNYEKTKTTSNFFPRSVIEWYPILIIPNKFSKLPSITHFHKKANFYSCNTPMSNSYM